MITFPSLSNLLLNIKEQADEKRQSQINSYNEAVLRRQELKDVKKAIRKKIKDRSIDISIA